MTPAHDSRNVATKPHDVCITFNNEGVLYGERAVRKKVSSFTKRTGIDKVKRGSCD